MEYVGALSSRFTLFVVAAVAAIAAGHSAPANPPVETTRDHVGRISTHEIVTDELFGVAGRPLVIVGPAHDGEEVRQTGLTFWELGEGGDPVRVGPTGDLRVVRSLRFDSGSHVDVDDETGTTTMVWWTAELVSGVVSNDSGTAQSFLGLETTWTGMVIGGASAGSPLEGEVTTLEIYLAYDSADDASSMLENLEPRPDGTVKSPVDCHSAWLGHDGYECCSFRSDWNLDRATCFASMKLYLRGCIAGVGVAALATLKYCCSTGLCVNPYGIAACLLAGALVGFIGHEACVDAAMDHYHGCIASKARQFRKELRATGCLEGLPSDLPDYPYEAGAEAIVSGRGTFSGRASFSGGDRR